MNFLEASVFVDPKSFSRIRKDLTAVELTSRMHCSLVRFFYLRLGKYSTICVTCCIQWWRVCLDEAQMIENTMTKTAEMALRISAVNRW